MNEGLYNFKTPYKATLLITDDCNLSCKHCFMNARENGTKDMTISQWIDIIDEIKSNIVEWEISGGEPFFNHELMFAIMNKIKTENLGNITLTTNGFGVKKKMIRKLLDYTPHLHYVRFSLEGSTEEVHNKIRNGGFNECLEGLKILGKSDITTTATFTIHQNTTPEDMDHIFELAKEYNFVPAYGNLFAIGRGIKNWDKILGHPLDLRKLNNHYNSLMRKNFPQFNEDPRFKSEEEFLEPLKPCPTILSNTDVTIFSDGTIAPCSFLKGSVKADYNDIKNYSDNLTINQLKTIERKDDHKICLECPIRHRCKKCPGRSFTVFGDARAPMPECIFFYELLGLKKELVYPYIDFLINQGAPNPLTVNKPTIRYS